MAHAWLSHGGPFSIKILNSIQFKNSIKILVVSPAHACPVLFSAAFKFLFFFSSGSNYFEHALQTGPSFSLAAVISSKLLTAQQCIVFGHPCVISRLPMQ